MRAGKFVFAQLMEFLPWKRFQRLVLKYGGDRYVKHFSCGNQFLSMAFAQLTYRESLRDIEACLRAHSQLRVICASERSRTAPRKKQLGIDDASSASYTHLKR